MKIDWKRSWWTIPFVPFRAVILMTVYYILQPLTNGLEYVGSLIPGLKSK